MDLSTEIVIEYKRLKRNADDLSYSWKEHTARDLVACLRNWVQLTGNIDTYCKDKGWDLIFPTHQKTKYEKRVFSDGSEACYFPNTVSNGPLKVQSVSFHEGKISQDNIRAIANSRLNGEPNNQSNTLTSWFNTEVYEMKMNGKRIGISRKLFIERCANMLGGTHPASTYDPKQNEQIFDQQITELMGTQVVNIPLPWTFINEAGDGILKAFDSHIGDVSE